MKIFVDTANLEEIEKAVLLGLTEGVTTNPSLIAKETGEKFETIIKKICGLVSGPVSAEVVSLDYKGMVKEARKLKKIAKNVIIKVPMTEEGIKAVSILEKENIKCNVTLVFSVNQALMAAKAGASYVSPFLGRLDDMGQDGIGLIEEILILFENYKYKTEVIAASIRHPDHVKQVALLGCHIATIPFNVIKKLYNHVLTDKGLKAFLNDWKKVKK
ncbi:fructose-6-phosphate aldolase [Patescibacteria group bacterium]